MSTDLYGVRILDTKPEEKTFKVKIFVVYYDVAYKSHQPIPEDYSFFFRILWDKGDVRFEKGGSIGREVTVDEFLDESWVDKNTFKFIENVELLSTANFPVNDFTSFSDFYYENDGIWEDEEKLVQAIYEIKVTDKKYLEHLKTGMSWGTIAYETNAVKIAYSYQKRLLDISNLTIRLNPFQEKKQEEGTICNALFSKDNSKLFVLSEAGELVTYNTQNWIEEWRYDTGKLFGTIQYDDNKRIVWVDDKTILSFDGEKVNQTILPNFEANYENVEIVKSPSGNYFLFSRYSKIIIYNKEGNLLWEYECSIEDYSLLSVFFENEERLIVREEMSGIFKIFELDTGFEVQTFKIEGTITNMALDPTGSFLSVNNLNSNSTKIIELKSTQLIFDYSTKYQNDDYLSACIWSPNNELAVIITTGDGTRQSTGYGGYLSVYPIGNKCL